MSTIVLATGGTGGHLFPAQALAAELTKRGRKIVVMTDARGTQYPTYFPGAAIEIVPRHEMRKHIVPRSAYLRSALNRTTICFGAASRWK